MAQKPQQPKSEEFKKALAFSETFSSGPGAFVLKDLFKSYYDVPSYVRGDTHETAVREGGRAVIFYILSQLKQSKHPEWFERTPDEIQDDE